MKEKLRKNKLVTLLIIVIISCLTFIGIYYGKQYKANYSYQELKKEAVFEPEEKPNEINKDKKTQETELLKIDFDKLKERNKDIYAWINIPGTSINYPVLQSDKDDGYYLNHTVDRVAGFPGSIYTEKYNAKDFSDRNTIIYGHNMKNDTMFTGLHKYEDIEFLKSHPKIYVYFENKCFIYEIFAAVLYSDVHIMSTYDFKNDKSYMEFLKSVCSSKNTINHYIEGINVTTEDKILTLSTCASNKPNNRYLIIGKLCMDQ